MEIQYTVLSPVWVLMINHINCPFLFYSMNILYTIYHIEIIYSIQSRSSSDTRYITVQVQVQSWGPNEQAATEEKGGLCLLQSNEKVRISLDSVGLLRHAGSQGDSPGFYLGPARN